MHIQNCTSQQFELIKKYIAKFELDNRRLDPSQFLVATDVQNRVLGFGRLRHYAGFAELCSLAVIPEERLKGIATQICNALIQKAQGPVYLVSVIPSFFKSLNFSICTTFPAEIKDKLKYCIDSLHVEEKYLVMKRA